MVLILLYLLFIAASVLLSCVVLLGISVLVARRPTRRNGFAVLRAALLGAAISWTASFGLLLALATSSWAYAFDFNALFKLTLVTGGAPGFAVAGLVVAATHAHSGRPDAA